MKTTPLSRARQQPLLRVLLPALLFGLAPMVWADSATPFVEINNHAGDVSTAHAYVSEIAPPSGTRPGSYAVIVLDDTLRPVALTATAAAGVVSAALLGREASVKARVVTPAKPASPPMAGQPATLEILTVTPLTNSSPPPASPSAGTPPKTSSAAPDPQLDLHTAMDDLAGLWRAGDFAGAYRRYTPPATLAKQAANPRTMQAIEEAVIRAGVPGTPEYQDMQPVIQTLDLARDNKLFLKETGDTATYTLTNDPFARVVLSFVKVDGKWYRGQGLR